MVIPLKKFLSLFIYYLLVLKVMVSEKNSNPCKSVATTLISYSVEDFKSGWLVPGSLKAKRIDGGVVLVSNDFVIK